MNSQLGSTEILARAIREGLPIVVVLGQGTAASPVSGDIVLQRALEKAGRTGTTWSDLLDKEDLEPQFYQWLSERFMRRTPPQALQAIADMPVSAVYTSSIDTGISNLFSTNGREPRRILLGNTVPSELRSTRRPPIFYLFGRCGVGEVNIDPPLSRQSLNKRRFQHANAMLRNLSDSATALGLILVEGFSEGDWLTANDLLPALAFSPEGSVIWFGADPKFSSPALEEYTNLVENGTILRDERSLGEVYEELRTDGMVPLEEKWDDPELITLPHSRQLIVTPTIRLLTEATASIVDDSWTGFLAPLPDEYRAAAFQSFHRANLKPRALIEGIRRGFSFERDFETELQQKVGNALKVHHKMSGALILHGQSGVGKSIALGRLAIHARSLHVPVLMVSDSITLQPNDISRFLEAAGEADVVSLLLIDANNSPQRYDEILFALRSRGYKVVVLGTSYKSEERGERWILAPSNLSKREHKLLGSLSKEFHPNSPVFETNTEHALAKFYWSLPESRQGMAEGLSKEARFFETALRLKEVHPRGDSGLSSMALAMVAAGYGKPDGRLLESEVDSNDIDLESPAAKLIDYVMVVSRLHKAVPINLLMRTVLSAGGRYSVNIETIRDLFVGEDMFRWREGGRDQSELVVQARLQIEAELVCNRRLGTPLTEAALLRELLANAARAALEGSEDAHFATDIVYAIGPDGPAGDRYRDAYLEVARTLTKMREESKGGNARLMLQESTLRRAYIKTHESSISAEEKEQILQEAASAVETALAEADPSNANPLQVPRRTREHLLTERAATYGYIATESAKNGRPAELWAIYRTAKNAALLAAGRTPNYQPLDIALWVPIRILKAGGEISDAQRIELEADIRATLDRVDVQALPHDQIINFERQRLSAADVLRDETLSKSAFEALDQAGSPVGYYLAARKLAPTRPDTGHSASIEDIVAAKRASDYLNRNQAKIDSDPRSLYLLFAMEWLQSTSSWVFRGLRQPLPFNIEEREKIRRLSSKLLEIEKESTPAQYRYIDAVLHWLMGNTAPAKSAWADLARETEYVEAKRISNRHWITNERHAPIIYSGVVTRHIGQKRWAVKVNELNQEVDLQEDDFPQYKIQVATEIANFAVSFNYRGPIADPFHSGGQ